MCYAIQRIRGRPVGSPQSPWWWERGGLRCFYWQRYFTLCVKEWEDKKLLHGIGQSLLLIYREQIGDCEIIESLRNTPSISNYKSQEHRYQDIQWQFPKWHKLLTYVCHMWDWHPLKWKLLTYVWRIANWHALSWKLLTYDV